MPHITTPDNTRLYFKDWGPGRPVILIHGWPLSADSWDDQALAIASLPMTGAALAGRHSPGAATTTTPCPTTWPR